MTLESFARLRHSCNSLLETAAKSTHARLPGMKPHLLVMLIWSLAKLEGLCRKSGSMAGLVVRDLLQQAASDPLKHCLHEIFLPDAAKLAWAFASSEIQPGELTLVCICVNQVSSH